MIREVTPGQSINTAIQQSLPGDIVKVKAGAYTGGIVMNRPGVTLEFDPLVIIRGANNGNAIQIQASDLIIRGLGGLKDRVIFEDFRSGIGSNQITGRNNILIENITQRRTNYGFWISGDNWTVKNCEVDRIIKRDTGGDADYGRIFGNGHKVQRNWFHGTKIAEDITPGHTDCLQHYNQNGEVLKNILIEDNIFEDFVQALFLGNETGNTSSMSNITIRNNVFWGKRAPEFTSNGIYLGAPSWTLYAGKNGPITGLIFENNTLVNSSNFLGVISGTKATVRKNICLSLGTKLGTVWILEGNPASNITTGPEGNIHYNYNWIGEMQPSTDKLINPQMRGTVLLGPSGDPWGADVGYVVLNTAAAGYGAKFNTVVVPPVEPPVEPPVPPTTNYVTKTEFEAYKVSTNLLIQNQGTAINLQNQAIQQLESRVLNLETSTVKREEMENVTLPTNVLRMKQ